MNIKNTALFIEKALINGEWISKTENIEVSNPANGQVIGKVPNLDKEDAKNAIESAYKSFNTWKNTTAGERSNLLRKWFNLIIENADDLAYILTKEQGKPLAEAKGEIIYGASFIEWFAEEAKRTYGDVIPSHMSNKRIITIKQPIGVVAAITPWNFPNAMITRKVAPALAAGCTVVIKPASETPFSALAIAKLAELAGIPKGVINVITSKQSSKIGEELTTNPLVKKVSFTGSTEIGKILMKQASGTVKKLSLELGGNAPLIVFEDADLDQAVEGTIISKFRNAGQTCVCTNRILVHEKVYDKYCEKLITAVKKLKMGDGLETDVNIGPLINENAANNVKKLIETSSKEGAKILLGGNKSQLGKCFIDVTILGDVNQNMTIAKEEIFGPVATLFKFKNDEEAIRIANDTQYGLAAYFYGRDISRIWKVAEALEYGMVGVNTGLISTTVAPFGGVKESGFGREGSKYGIEEYLTIKYVCLEING